MKITPKHIQKFEAFIENSKNSGNKETKQPKDNKKTSPAELLLERIAYKHKKTLYILVIPETPGWRYFQYCESRRASEQAMF